MKSYVWIESLVEHENIAWVRIKMCLLAEMYKYYPFPNHRLRAVLWMNMVDYFVLFDLQDVCVNVMKQNVVSY